MLSVAINSAGRYFGFLVEYGFVLKLIVNGVKQIFIPKTAYACAVSSIVIYCDNNMTTWTVK